MTRALQPELALLAACCRWPAAPARDAAVRVAAAVPPDWSEFERLLRRHRVVALACNGLASAGIQPPPDVAERLRSAAAVQARTALAMAGETLRLQRLFDTAGVRALVVKGAALGRLAYGDIGLKQARDVDFLVAFDAIPQARALLEGAGYVLADLPADDDGRGFALMLSMCREITFVHAASGVVVDLHWALTENPAMLPGLGLSSECQDVAMAGAVMRTLADAPLYAYLCAHGGGHAWARLKWLADLSAFLGVQPPGEMERLHRASLAMGGGRTSALALVLCHDVMGLAVPASLLKEVRADRIVMALAGNAIACLQARESERKHSLAATLRLNIALPFLKPGLGYARSELARIWVSVGDRQALKLPRGLHPLYHVIRIPAVLLRHAVRMVRPQSTPPR